jgi:hypothetical protein
VLRRHDLDAKAVVLKGWLLRNGLSGLRRSGSQRSTPNPARFAVDPKGRSMGMTSPGSATPTIAKLPLLVSRFRPIIVRSTPKRRWKNS